MQNLNAQTLSQQVFFITDLEVIIGRNRLTLRRWWMDGKFPQPVKLNGTTLAWHSNVILDWINQNVKMAGASLIPSNFLIKKSN